jgi:hypothetical protein
MCQGENYGRTLFEAALQKFKNDDTSVIGLDAVIESKATYERRGFVESSLGENCYMSRNISSIIHHTTSHDPDTSLELVSIKDNPCHLLAKAISITQAFNADSFEVASFRTEQTCPGLH